ncbi:MAG: hypothetical protein PUF48_00945 [Oscillospiraceae bacterium]|nr:hypothetical protein [Oscillospiraceae bacterium]
MKQTIGTTLVMLVVTGTIGFALYCIINGFSVQVSQISLFWAVALALLMIPHYTIGIKVLSLGSLAIYSMFMMLGGMLVPFFYGILFLNETLSIGKILGSVLLTVCIILQAILQKPSAEADEKSPSRQKGKFLFLCMAAFFINGFTGVIAKAHGISEGAVDAISFIVIYCGIMAIFSFVLLLLFLLKDGRTKWEESKKTLKRKPFFLMVALGVVAYTGNFLHLKAAVNVPASVQFPLVSGGVIVLSSVIAALAFKERISAKEWISLAGACVATALFAF